MVKTADYRDIIKTRFPREIAAGVFWLGDCMVWEYDGTKEHSYSSTFLVVGSERSILVDTGHIKDWLVVRNQVDGLIAKGIPAPESIFPTHTEVTHSGNTGRWLTHFPKAKACGDLRDAQLIWPQHAERLIRCKKGDAIDLGGRKFVFVEAVIRDLVSTYWGYDTKEQVLFSSDGLSFGHFHQAEQCGKTAEEIPDLPIPELTGLFAEYALYWTRLKSCELALERLQQMMEKDYPTRIVASAHGSIITDPTKTMPLIREGMRRVSSMAVDSSVAKAKG